MAGNILAAERIRYMEQKLKVGVCNEARILLTDRTIVRNVLIKRTSCAIELCVSRPMLYLEEQTPSTKISWKDLIDLPGQVKSEVTEKTFSGDAQHIVAARNYTFRNTERGYLETATATKIIIKSFLTGNLSLVAHPYYFENCIFNGLYLWDPVNNRPATLFGLNQLLEAIEYDLDIIAKAHLWDGSDGSFEEPEGKSLRKLIRD